MTFREWRPSSRLGKSDEDDARRRIAHSRAIHRQYRTGIRLDLPGPLETKKSARKDRDDEKQRQIAAKLKLLKRRQFRGPIAVQLHLAPMTKNPPSIQKGVKYLLDILGKPFEPRILKRKGLIYGDDAQIDYLAIDYHPSLQMSDTDCYAHFYPIRSFYADLGFVWELGVGNPGFEDDLHDIRELRDNLLDTLRKEKVWREKRGDAEFEAMVQMERYLLQDAYFKECHVDVYELSALIQDSTKLPDHTLPRQKFVRSVRRMNVGKLEIGNAEIDMRELDNWMAGLEKSDVAINKSLYASWANALLTSPSTIHLPLPPVSKGQSKAYEDGILEAFRTFASKNNLLFPLRVPVRLQMFFKAAPGTGDGVHKDLDNILLSVLPKFNEVFKPTLSPVSSRGRHEQKGGVSIDRSLGFPLPQGQSVRGVEIIRVPRAKEDQRSGYLALRISSAFSYHGDWMGEAWNRFEKAKEHEED
jgi:hypothetical protein